MSNYNEMRSQANKDVAFQRGENQKVITDTYRKNFDKIFKKKYNATHEEVTNGSVKQE